MSRNCPSNLRERGFTLIEATISMALLLIVLLMSMTFLITMRTFAQRQEMFAQPRQSARRAVDYIAQYLRGATDMNYTAQSPNAVVCYYNSGGNTLQATFNNITNAAYGDLGTDMISVAVPTWDAAAPTTTYIDPSTTSASTTPSVVNFTAGCGSAGTDTTGNLALFKSLTGAHTEGGVLVSNLLTVSDSSGGWSYYKITGYPTTCTCSGTGNVSFYSSPTTLITPPGGASTLTTPNLLFVQYASFRVKNGQLQQKTGLFDSGATTANEDALFNTLLPDIEDLQIAYIYDNGNVYNANLNAWSSTNPGGLMGTMDPAGTTETDVPTQAGPSGTAGALDATNVIGLRVSIVARSSQISDAWSATQNFYFRPASEDRAAGAADRRFHYRLTSTVLLRNRALGM